MEETPRGSSHSFRHGLDIPGGQLGTNWAGEVGLQEHSDAGEPPGSGHRDSVPMGSGGRNADIPGDTQGQLLDAGLDDKLERWRDVLS